MRTARTTRKRGEGRSGFSPDSMRIRYSVNGVAQSMTVDEYQKEYEEARRQEYEKSLIEGGR